MYGLLQAKVDGSFSFSFTPDLKPNMVLGDAHLDISLQAAGPNQRFCEVDRAVAAGDLSPTEIKALSLNFEKDGVHLGEYCAQRAVRREKSEGRVDVELLFVDKKAFNLLGAKSWLSILGR